MRERFFWEEDLTMSHAVPISDEMYRAIEEIARPQGVTPEALAGKLLRERLAERQAISRQTRNGRPVWMWRLNARRLVSIPRMKAWMLSSRRSIAPPKLAKTDANL